MKKTNRREFFKQLGLIGGLAAMGKLSQETKLKINELTMNEDFSGISSSMASSVLIFDSKTGKTIESDD